MSYILLIDMRSHDGRVAVVSDEKRDPMQFETPKEAISEAEKRIACVAFPTYLLNIENGRKVELKNAPSSHRHQENHARNREVSISKSIPKTCFC